MFTPLFAELLGAIIIYSLSAFVFFNQRRNRVNVWFLILMNTITGIFFFCFLNCVPSLNFIGDLFFVMWDSLKLFFLSLFPFALLAYINAKTRFKETRWVMYGSIVILALISAEVSMIWSVTFNSVSKYAVMMVSVSVAAIVSSYIVFKQSKYASLYIKVGLALLVLSPFWAYLRAENIYIMLFVFGILLFADLRKYNATTLNKKQVARFIIENTDDALIVADKDRKIIFCNKNARKKLGLSILNASGEYLESIVSLESGEPWQPVKKTRVKVDLNQLMTTEEFVITFSEIKRKDVLKGYVLIF